MKEKQRSWQRFVRGIEFPSEERPITDEEVRKMMPWALLIIGVIVTLLIIGQCRSVYAEPTFHPSRARLLMHGAEQFNDEMGMSVHFIPAGNLIGELSPKGYLELNWKPWIFLTLSPCLGLDFKANEIIPSIRLTPKVGKFWGWIDFEVRPQSWGFYWFAQVEYSITKFLHVGVEEESWGDFNAFGQATHGGGPNLLLRFGQYFGVDFALHYRRLNDEVKPEFFVRVHLFF